MEQNDVRPPAGFLVVVRYRLPWMRFPVSQMCHLDLLLKAASLRVLEDQKASLAGSVFEKSHEVLYSFKFSGCVSVLISTLNRTLSSSMTYLLGKSELTLSREANKKDVLLRMLRYQNTARSALCRYVCKEHPPRFRVD